MMDFGAMLEAVNSGNDTQILDRFRESWELYEIISENQL
jgi:hypothetical protein